MSCQVTSTTVDEAFNKVSEFAKDIYDELFKPIIDNEYNENSISKEERARLRLEYMATAVQSITVVVDGINKQIMLPKECEKIDSEISLTKQQKQVALSQGKLYAQQRKSFINRDVLNIIDEYMKGWVTALSEGVTDANAYPIIASELRNKMDTIYTELLKEADNEANCKTKCVSIDEVN